MVVYGLENYAIITTIQYSIYDIQSNLTLCAYFAITLYTILLWEKHVSVPLVTAVKNRVNVTGYRNSCNTAKIMYTL